MPRRLNDMVVIITGASAGIGRAVAQRLSARGARLVLGARRIERLQELNQQMSGRHLVLRADVAQRDDCQMMVDRAREHFGRIDTLVCNAGYGAYRTMAQTTRQEMEQIFATNVFGTTDCIHGVLPHMIGQEPRDGWRGQIMIVSSCVARRGVPYLGPYCATKAAQLGIAEALRVELRPHQIAVTSVHPIQTRTEFGQTARRLGGMELAQAAVAQTVESVARRMIDAIISPRPEVWPYRPARWFFGLGTMFPRVLDWVMDDFRKKVRALNSSTNSSTEAELPPARV